MRNYSSRFYFIYYCKIFTPANLIFWYYHTPGNQGKPGSIKRDFIKISANLAISNTPYLEKSVLCRQTSWKTVPLFWVTDLYSPRYSLHMVKKKVFRCAVCFFYYDRIESGSEHNFFNLQKTKSKQTPSQNKKKKPNIKYIECPCKHPLKDKLLRLISCFECIHYLFLLYKKCLIYDIILNPPIFNRRIQN